MGAKLFSIAALVIAVIALVPARATDTSLDLWVHATYIVVTPRQAILAFVLLCGAFAGLYYFVGQALGPIERRPDCHPFSVVAFLTHHIHPGSARAASRGSGRTRSQSILAFARGICSSLSPIRRRCSCIPCELCPGNCTEASKPQLKIIVRCGRSWLATAVGMGPTSA